MAVKTQYTPEELEKALVRKRALLKKPENLTNQQLEDIFHHKSSGKYVGDFVYGANFAVVSGAVGASLSPLVIIILGFANLFADGFSMGASSFLSKRSDIDYQKGQRKKEEWEAKNLPEIETQEVRDIFSNMGLTGVTLDKAVETTISDKKRWVDLMMVHELGIIEEEKDDPLKHGLATFGAFILAGIAPLLPFLIPVVAENALIYSPLFAGIALFVAGALRTLITPKRWWIGGLEMLFVGALAGIVSYGIGYILKSVIGISS
jgi:vacuolar iron transporter family protein